MTVPPTLGELVHRPLDGRAAARLGGDDEDDPVHERAQDRRVRHGQHRRRVDEHPVVAGLERVDDLAHHRATPGARRGSAGCSRRAGRASPCRATGWMASEICRLPTMTSERPGRLRIAKCWCSVGRRRSASTTRTLRAVGGQREWRGSRSVVVLPSPGLRARHDQRAPALGHGREEQVRAHDAIRLRHRPFGIAQRGGPRRGRARRRHHRGDHAQERQVHRLHVLGRAHGVVEVLEQQREADAEGEADEQRELVVARCGWARWARAASPRCSTMRTLVAFSSLSRPVSLLRSVRVW